MCSARRSGCRRMTRQLPRPLVQCRSAYCMRRSYTHDRTHAHRQAPPPKGVTNIPPCTNTGHACHRNGCMVRARLRHRSGAPHLSLGDLSRGGWTMSRAIITRTQAHAHTGGRLVSTGSAHSQQLASRHRNSSSRADRWGAPSRRLAPRSFPRHNAIRALQPTGWPDVDAAHHRNGSRCRGLEQQALSASAEIPTLQHCWGQGRPRHRNSRPRARHRNGAAPSVSLSATSSSIPIAKRGREAHPTAATVAKPHRRPAPVGRPAAHTPRGRRCRT